MVRNVRTYTLETLKILKKFLSTCYEIATYYHNQYLLQLTEYIQRLFLIILNRSKDYYCRRVGIHLRKKFIARNRRKIFYAGANTHKASNSIARNGVTSFNVYGYYYYYYRNLRIFFVNTHI